MLVCSAVPTLVPVFEAGCDHVSSFEPSDIHLDPWTLDASVSWLPMTTYHLSSMQAAAHPAGAVCNREALDVSTGQALVSEGERLSLTVRRVLKVRRLLR